MIERKKMWIVCSVVVVLVCSVIMNQLLQLPVPKQTLPDYILGTTVPVNASHYFNNVSAEDTVTIVQKQFEAEGNHTVDVTLKGVQYKLKQKMIKPNLLDVVFTKTGRQTIVSGESYQRYFKIREDLMDDVTFSVPSEQLNPGNVTLTISAFGQTATQELTVLAKDSRVGQLQQQFDFSKALSDVVNAYLESQKLPQENVAFVYRNFVTNQHVVMNDTTVTLASETVELPIAMLGEKASSDGNIEKETVKTLIDNMIRLSSAMAERTLTNHIGGIEKVYNQISEFGKVDGNVATVTQISGQTTAKYFAQVLEKLYQNKEQYPLTIDALKNSGNNRYISRYLGETVVWHRPATIGQIINDVAIVEDAQPYGLVLFTRDLTGNQYVEIAYLINEWHKKNH